MSASEDGTARIWDLDNSRCIKILEGHNKKYEVLRACWAPPEANRQTSVTLATGSADGTVRLWGTPPKGNDDEAAEDDAEGRSGLIGRCPGLKVVGKLQHKDEAKGLDGQVYSCQFILGNASPGAAAEGNHASSSLPCSSPQGELRLLTASDCSVHLWDVETRQRVSSQALDKLGDHSIGGERNPEDLSFVFDAKPQPGTGSSTLAVALSDGTVRVGDILGDSGQTVVLRREDGTQTHLTGLTWSGDGLLLASCAGDGSVTLWDARTWTARAVLRGHSRPVYGATFHPSPAECGPGGTGGDEPQLLLSWSSDETVCAWDAGRASGRETKPLVSIAVDEGFPVYHCSVSADGRRLAVAGGGGGGKVFVGVPIKVVELDIQDAAKKIGR